MTAGHLAAVLIPFGRLRRVPLWLLLLATQLPDVVWWSLALLGIEEPTPRSFIDVTVSGLQVDMAYSHAVVGVAVTAVFVAIVVASIWRRVDLALWCAGLVLLHEACDLLSGFEHGLLFGRSTEVGFGLYRKSPPFAFALEAAFSALMVALYLRGERQQGRDTTRKRKAVLYTFFVASSLIYLPTSYHSMRSLQAGALSGTP
ncbi:MAG: hypothetical protein U0174_03290 [Polyangiaceae bacterium]